MLQRLIILPLLTTSLLGALQYKVDVFVKNGERFLS